MHRASGVSSSHWAASRPHCPRMVAVCLQHVGLQSRYWLMPREVQAPSPQDHQDSHVDLFHPAHWPHCPSLPPAQDARPTGDHTQSGSEHRGPGACPSAPSHWPVPRRTRSPPTVPSPASQPSVEPWVLSCRSPPGLQPSPPHRAEQEGDDLPLRDAGLSGGAHHAGGQAQDDAHPPGGAAWPRLQVGLHDQAGAGRHPQVWHRGALQG